MSAPNKEGSGKHVAYVRLADFYALLAYSELIENHRGRPIEDQDFQKVLQLGVDLLGITNKAIARNFGCSLPTVARWKTGANAPHPAMRGVVLEWLSDCVVEQLTSTDMGCNK